MAKSIGSFTSEYFTPEKRKEWAEKQRASWTPERRLATSIQVRNRMTGTHLPKSQRDKIGASNRGRVFSEESRKKISDALIGRKYPERSAAIRQHLLDSPDGCRCQFHRPGAGSPTRIEDILVRDLLKEFPKVVREKWFGRYRVDAYLPAPYHLAFEADGKKWHGSKEAKERDKKRDLWLKKNHNLTVIRFSEAELWEILNIKIRAAA